MEHQYLEEVEFENENTSDTTDNTYKSVHFRDLCRLCASGQDLPKVFIFDEDVNAAESLKDKIWKVLNINVTRTDPLPKVVCSNCVKSIDGCFTFRKQCHNSAVTLSSYYNKFKDTDFFRNEGKVYIKSGGTSIPPQQNSNNSGNGEVKKPPKIVLKQSLQITPNKVIKINGKNVILVKLPQNMQNSIVPANFKLAPKNCFIGNKKNLEEKATITNKISKNVNNNRENDSADCRKMETENFSDPFQEDMIEIKEEPIDYIENENDYSYTNEDNFQPEDIPKKRHKVKTHVDEVTTKNISVKKVISIPQKRKHLIKNNFTTTKADKQNNVIQDQQNEEKANIEAELLKAKQILGCSRMQELVVTPIFNVIPR